MWPLELSRLLGTLYRQYGRYGLFKDHCKRKAVHKSTNYAHVFVFPRHFGHFAVFLVGPNLFFRLQSSCKEIQKFPAADIIEANLIQDPDTG